MRRALLLIAGLLAATIAPAAGQTYPAKPVKIVVPFAPAGGNDLFARKIAQALSEQWKQSVFVENRPGAGGTIGTDAVAKAAPDGYTILLGHTGTMSINPALYPTLPFDAAKDFAAVGRFAFTPLVLVVNADSPIGDLKALLARAKAKPGDLTYGSGGNGTGAHLAGALMADMAALSITHVPYKGTSPAVQDLLGGRLSFMFSVFTPALPQIKAGKLKALAVTSTARVALLPDTPTMAEAGLPTFESSLTYGLLVPKGTPDAIIAEINKQMAVATATADFRQILAAEGAEAASGTPAEYSAIIASETAKWTRVVKAAGIKPE